MLDARAVQLAVLAARYRIPVILPQREFVEAGGLMSYGTDIADSIRQVGVYAGKVLKGAKPADLAGRAVDQVRVRHQSANREVARHRYASDVTLTRRQSHRMKLVDFRYWHKADIRTRSINVRFWG
jgi:ABC-type uncharacterized transport system substrate-binding protein